MGKLCALLGSAALVALAANGAWAQNSRVEWRDDGTVALHMGPEYDGQTIVVKQSDLGSEFGPGKKPFEGVKIAVTVNGAGPKGGISGPLHSFRPIWQELAGGDVDIVELPFAEHYTKMMLDLRNGTGQYDAFMVGAFWYGDIVPAGYGYQIDELMGSGKYPQWSYDVMPPSLKKLHQWEGKSYGILNDADGQVLYYRKSVLENPEHKAGFKQQFGYDLPSPPTTWQQLLDISTYFNGKNWDQSDAEPDSGTVLHLKVGEQGHYHFQSMSASFVINPGDKVTQTENVYWFDPTTMKPLINSPGHLKALEFLQSLHKTGPSAQVGWSLGEAWDYFLRGKAVFVYSWGDVGALCQDKSRSKVQGDCAAAVIPSSTEYWSFKDQKWVTLDQPRLVGNTTGGSWHGVISNFSANPEAAYSFLSLMAMPPVSKMMAMYGWDGVDPGYSYQFLKEDGGTATADEYVKAGWSPEDAKSYTHAYKETFYAPTTLTYLRIPGTFEYWDILDKNLSAAMSGSKNAKQALDDTATAWEGVTERIGRDQQLKDYQAAIGYGQ
jgi:multiple sugar transport system substrate-binding protein